MEQFDTIIIGFGKAGKTIAGKLAGKGERVALIEKDSGMYGGTCINVGCIPSKRLVTDAAAAPRGSFEEKSAYYRQVIEDKRKLTGALRAANLNKLLKAGVKVYDGHAEFLEAHILSVTDAQGARTQLRGEKNRYQHGREAVDPSHPGRSRQSPGIRLRNAAGPGSAARAPDHHRGRLYRP